MKSFCVSIYFPILTTSRLSIASDLHAVAAPVLTSAAIVIFCLEVVLRTRQQQTEYSENEINPEGSITKAAGALSVRCAQALERKIRVILNKMCFFQNNRKLRYV